MCDIGGLFIYLISLLLVFFAVILARRYSLISFCAFLCVAFVAAYRGDAGVDTELYILRFDNVGDLLAIGFIEPLTPFLMWCIVVVGGDFSDFSLLYGSILSAIYVYILRQYPNALYFGLAIFPVIFVDSLYNGVRIGLAYPIIFMAIISASLWMYFIAFFAHISSVVVGVFRIIAWKYFLLILIFLGIIIYALGISVDVLPYRYVSKFFNYQTLSSRSSFAGIADTVALWFAITIYLRVVGYRARRWFFSSFLVFVFLSILYFMLIKDFMFMLRVVRLVLIATFALIAARHARLDRISLLLSIAFGVIYTVNFLRQISASCSYEHGGFLPLDYGLY